MTKSRDDASAELARANSRLSMAQAENEAAKRLLEGKDKGLKDEQARLQDLERQKREANDRDKADKDKAK